MAREKLSVVVLTKNEEKYIAACLDTVTWADEIIVVDDNSTDRTAEIAGRYKAKVAARALGGDFSAQRNFGNERASSDWILQMDADERVTPDLKAAIEKILTEGSDKAAFRFGRANNFCGKFMKYGGADTHRPLRLFRRGKARFSGDTIHEKLAVDGSVGDLDAVIEHYHFPDINHYIETQNFYTELEAKAMAKAGPLIPKKKLKQEMSTGVLKLFFKLYIKKQGYKDGTLGLIFAVLSAWRRFLIYAKYWELNRAAYQEKGS